MKIGEGIELSINGYFRMIIFNMNGSRVEADIEQGILDNLQQGEYMIGIDSKNIFDINDLYTPLYNFTLEATINTNYEFDNF